VQWPFPRQVTALAAVARRHYLRVSAEPHAGLVRRVESLVRRAGLSVQSRAARGEARLHHHAFVLSPSTDAKMIELVDQIARLGRVERRSWLGVAE
jgi:hypothetical protein